MLYKLIEEISQAEMVLIGVGSEAASDYKININEAHSKKEWIDYKKYSDVGYKQKIIKFYNDLERIISGKNYFVVTTNYDGYVYESNINPIRIVAPCGDINRLQCQCEGAEGIADAPMDYYENDESEICLGCGAPCVPNVYNKEYYNEEGYLKQWNLYNKWLQGTLNKKLLVLEIGCDFSMLSVIRLPFEKVVMINQKAKFYRINEKFPQITAELKDRMISINKNPFDFTASCCSIL